MREKRVVILGGGISGLTAAYYLRKLARENGIAIRCMVLESDTRFGGKIRTWRTDTSTLELGPDSLFTPKFQGIDLIDELELRGDIVPMNAAGTYLFRSGKLHPLPPGLTAGIPSDIQSFARTRLVSPQGKLRALRDLILPGPPLDGDVSLGLFLRKRFGNEFVDVMVAPLLAGIHAADIDRLSLDATMPSLRKLYEEHRSLIRGVMSQKKRRQPGDLQARGPLFISLKHGLESLVERLVENLRPDVDLVTQARCISVAPQGSGDGYCVRIEQRGVTTELAADAVMVTVPAYQAAHLLEPFAFNTDLLSGIRYVSTATVVMGHKSDGIQPVSGSGFLVPATESASITACTVVSTKWPHAIRGHDAVFRCYVGRDGQEDIVDESDESILGKVRSDLQRATGALPTPLLHRVTRWHRAMPQFDVGHLQRMEWIDRALSNHPGIQLAGAAYRGMGIPDCIRDGAQAAVKIIDFLKEPTVASSPAALNGVLP